MRSIKILALLLALVMLVACFAACKGNGGDGEQTTAPPQNPVVYQDVDLADAVEHEDYTSVYDMIGSKITIDMVTERDGLAYATYEGKEYELGMDFLSMAMVYNCSVPANSEKYTDAEDVFNEWWKLYIQRWNYLVPEVPLYSNQYFDLYNAKMENFVTSPYWSMADAIIAARVKEGHTNSVILGSSTELGGAFRNSSWGKSSPAASDLDIQDLTSGHSTVMTNNVGGMLWNMTALAQVPTAEFNEDGELTYTIKIKDSLVFSDGSPITAKNYIVGLLCNSTPVGVAAKGTGNSGLQVVGFDEFKAYTGTNDGAAVEGKDYTASKWFSGIKLLDDYTFSVTFQADYSNYYFAMSYASYAPSPMALYAGAAGDIVVNPDDKTVGFNDAFYATEKVDNVDTYTVAAEILANMEWDSDLPWSGPYVVSDYNESTKVATLTLNDKYIGDDARGVAGIQTLTYVKVVTQTQMDMFKTGQVDIIEGVMGAKETKDALALIASNPEKYAETHYDRAGYGKLAFRCDLGPTGFTEVRQAVMHTLNRNAFAQTYTGGYGTIVHGPYYTKYPAYAAVKDDILLNEYTYSVDSAIAVLEEGGWIYNVDGTAYDATKGGIRYKKLTGYEKTKNNLTFASTDNKYKTVKINGEYYMPLVINWVGTQPNDVTDQLIIDWQTSESATSKIGMYITYTSGEFIQAVYGDYCQYEAYGWNGTASCGAVNFATGFTSAIYDQSYYWTINQDYYADYSNNYLMDEADFWENYAD